MEIGGKRINVVTIKVHTGERAGDLLELLLEVRVLRGALGVVATVLRGFGGGLLGFLNAGGVVLQGGALAFERAGELDAGFVEFAELEIIERLVGALHDAVVVFAAVRQDGGVDEEGGGLARDGDFGLGVPILEKFVGGVEGGEAGIGIAGGAGGGASFEVPEDDIGRGAFGGGVSGDLGSALIVTGLPIGAEVFSFVRVGGAAGEEHG